MPISTITTQLHLDVMGEQDRGKKAAAELLVALNFDALRIRVEELRRPDRDRFVLSKGHTSCTLYTVLAHRGYFPVEELGTFRQLNSRRQCCRVDRDFVGQIEEEIHGKPTP